MFLDGIMFCLETCEEDKSSNPPASPVAAAGRMGPTKSSGWPTPSQRSPPPPSTANATRMTTMETGIVVATRTAAPPHVRDDDIDGLDADSRERDTTEVRGLAAASTAASAATAAATAASVLAIRP